MLKVKDTLRATVNLSFDGRVWLAGRGAVLPNQNQTGEPGRSRAKHAK